MMIDISTIMVMITTFLITTKMSNMEVLLVQAQVRGNTLRTIGDQTDGYQKVSNATPTMTVTMKMILN